MDGSGEIRVDQHFGPDLHLAIDGFRLAPTIIDGTEYRFTFPGSARDVIIRSHTNVPSNIYPSSND